MDTPPTTPQLAVENFFRHEAGRLHGALLRELGTERFSLAEDIAQEALLRALRAWSMGGIPVNPAAWITRVALNLARDHGRHYSMKARKEPDLIYHQELQAPLSASWDPNREVNDDTLSLLFVCCHPALPEDAQVMLALKTLGGLSVREIARAFFRSEAAVEKQLTRTKQRIQTARFPFSIPEPHEREQRINSVLDTLYLLFNEGYLATEGDLAVRVDLCREAIRLAELLASHPTGNTPRTHALLALFWLTAARMPARVDAEGNLVRLEEQDRSLWQGDAISRGLAHLDRATTGIALTDYHLQAGIAALHCTAPSAEQTDWRRILDHYDALLRLAPSPVVSLNRAVALAQVAGPDAAIASLMESPGTDRLKQSHLYHAVLGDLHARAGDTAESSRHYKEALRLCRVRPEMELLGRLARRPSDAGRGDSIQSTDTL